MFKTCRVSFFPSRVYSRGTAVHVADTCSHTNRCGFRHPGANGSGTWWTNANQGTNNNNKKKQDHLQAMRWKVAQPRRGPGTNGPGVLREEATSGLVLSREREQRVPRQTTAEACRREGQCQPMGQGGTLGQGGLGAEPQSWPRGQLASVYPVPTPDTPIAPTGFTISAASE